jgi:hypothetical protein
MTIENIALIIITAFVNLAVSSILFYRYQKKIEDTFARSFLEYQTKYVRNHEKAVETLEALYRQYLVFHGLYFDAVYAIEKSLVTTFDELSVTVSSALTDFSAIFDNNRIYLSPNEIKIIEGVYLNSHALNGILFVLSSSKEFHSDGIMKELNSWIPLLPAKISKLTNSKESFGKFISGLQEICGDQLNKLENLYKNTADVKI